MVRRISSEGPLKDFDPVVGTLWRSRNEEPKEQTFERLPLWMMPEPKDTDKAIDMKRLMPKIFETFSEREQEVILYRFWDDFSLAEVGQILGVCRERVRQIEAKIIRKFKHPSRCDLLLPYLDDVARLRWLEKKQKEEKRINKILGLWVNT